MSKMVRLITTLKIGWFLQKKKKFFKTIDRAQSFVGHRDAHFICFRRS